jgi:S1-C subfamily serine protease
MTRFAMTAVLLAFFALPVFADGGSSPPWSGISMEPVAEVPKVEGVPATSGIRVVDMPDGSPARKCGVLVGDIIGLTGSSGKRA